MNPGLVSLGSWLVVGSTEEESTDHVSHEVLRAKLDYVQESVTKVRAVCKECSEHAIGVLSRERENE